MLVKYLLRLKKVAIAIDNHRLSFAFYLRNFGCQSGKLVDDSYFER